VEGLKLFGMKAERGWWLLVLSGMLINLCLGSIYSWSVFVAFLTEYFTEVSGKPAAGCIHPDEDGGLSRGLPMDNGAGSGWVCGGVYDDEPRQTTSVAGMR
jgi:hypothetical protein